MPKIDPGDNDYTTGRYPKNLDRYYKGITDQYTKAAVGDIAGLTQFGANRVVLPPQSGTAMQHWHEYQDELVVIIEGIATLVDETGEYQLGPGDCAAFKAGDANGHCIINRGTDDVVLFEIGTRTPYEVVHYPGKDLKVEIDRTGATPSYNFTARDGAPID